MNKTLLLQAINAGAAYGKTLNVGWYPCGFAGIAYKCRKNAKVSKVLIECGFRWSDYEKQYRLSAPEGSQSMTAKEMVAQHIIDRLEAEGIKGFATYSRID